MSAVSASYQIFIASFSLFVYEFCKSACKNKKPYLKSVRAQGQHPLLKHVQMASTAAVIFRSLLGCPVLTACTARTAISPKISNLQTPTD